jgi:diguanylate cyclase
MEYSDFSREQLLNRIHELEMLTSELLKEKEQETRLEFAWSGNLGHWCWNVKSNEVTFNPLKILALGYDKSEIPEHVPYAFFTDKLHPEDYPGTMKAMLDHLYGKADVYETEYRIQAKDGSYKWFYDRGRITQTDESGKPVFLAGIVFDITEKKETQLELEYKNQILAEMSYIDELTKIANHRTLMDHLRSEISEADRTGKPLSIAIFDIDDFKRVNDLKGHVCGDQVLTDVTVRIRNSIRDTDFAGRYGGEEFMVIFSDTPLVSARNISERIRDAMESRPFLDDLSITVSGGVSVYSGEDLNALIQSADANMYEAKRAGKNRIAG